MKAQMSAEFLVVVAALVSISLLVYLLYSWQSSSLFQAGDRAGATRNAYLAAAALNYVHLAGDGASYNFTMSGRRNEENVSVFDFSVESVKPNARASAPVLNSNVNATELEGWEMMIRNNNGAIEIER